MKSQP